MNLMKPHSSQMSTFCPKIENVFSKKGDLLCTDYQILDKNWTLNIVWYESQKNDFDQSSKMLKSILNLPTGSFCDSLVVELPIVRIFDSWIFWTFVDLLPDERPKGGLDTEVVLAVNRFNHLGMTASQNCKSKKNEYFSFMHTHCYKSSVLSKKIF